MGSAAAQPLVTWRRSVRISLDRIHYRGNVIVVSIARSKVTAQGQISVPAKVREKLGIGPGSVIIWDEEEGRILVRRAGSYTSEDIHDALFPGGPPKRRSLKQLKDGLRAHIRDKHAGR